MKILDVEQNTEGWLNERKGMILGSNVYSVLSAKTGTKEEIIEVLNEAGIEYPVNGNGKPTQTKDVYEELLTPELEAKLMQRAEKKLEFYQLIADRIAIDTKYEYDENDEIVYNDQNMMDRGHTLEDEAAELFTERTGKDLAKVGMIVRDDNPDIGHSPDRVVKPEGVEDDVITELPKGKKITEEVEIKCLKSAYHLQAYIEQKIPENYFSQCVQYFVANDDLQTLYACFYDPRIPYECQLHWIEINRDDTEVAKRIPQYKAYEELLLAEVDKWVEKLTF